MLHETAVNGDFELSTSRKSSMPWLVKAGQRIEEGEFKGRSRVQIM